LVSSALASCAAQAVKSCGNGDVDGNGNAMYGGMKTPRLVSHEVLRDEGAPCSPRKLKDNARTFKKR